MPRSAQHGVEKFCVTRLESPVLHIKFYLLTGRRQKFHRLQFLCIGEGFEKFDLVSMPQVDPWELSHLRQWFREVRIIEKWLVVMIVNRKDPHAL